MIQGWFNHDPGLYSSELLRRPKCLVKVSRRLVAAVRPLQRLQQTCPARGSPIHGANGVHWPACETVS